MTNPSIEGLRNSLVDPMRTLQSIPAQLARHRNLLQQEVAEIENNPDWSPSAKARKTEEVRDAARDRLNNLMGHYEEAKGRVESILAMAAKGPEPADTNEALLWEMQEQRAANRIDKLMLSGKEIQEVVKIVGTDPAGVRALKAELPAHIAVVSSSGRELVERMKVINQEIGKAEEPFYTDVQREAKNIASEVGAGSYRVDMSAGFLREEVDGKSPATILTWGDGNVNDPGIIEPN